MSQQRPAPNPLITFLLWGGFIFLGYQLFFNKSTTNDSRTAEEVYQQIIKLDKAQDSKIAGEVTNYIPKLELEKKDGKITEIQFQEKQFYAEFLALHTSLIVGLKTDNHTSIQDAFNKLNDKFRKLGKTELWQKQFAVSPLEEKLPQVSLSGAELYDIVIKELAIHNKTAKVWGYIPGYDMMSWLVNLTGAVPGFSYWMAGLLLAIIVRVVVYPLAQKQFIWGRRMAQLGPYIKEIKEKFTDKKTNQVTDQQAMTMETMELYKKYGMNPFSGCLPMLIQMPLFLIIYQCMLFYRFEFNKGHFLWIQDGAGSFLGLPLAPNLGEQDYVLIVIYAISMVVTTLLTPVSDPANVRQQRLMGVGMSVLFSIFMFIYPLPSAFTAYWIFTNILTTAQSLYVYRMPLEPLVPVQSSKGGIIPTTGKDKNGKTDVAPGFFDKLGKKKK